MRGETAKNRTIQYNESISIHSPRAGRDQPIRFKSGTPIKNFNPLSPCGERPFATGGQHNDKNHFNPLSPCGERRGIGVFCESIHLFQSTLPVRGETDRHFTDIMTWAISIHSPRAGRDIWTSTSQHCMSDFNPLSPCGERHVRTHGSRADALEIHNALFKWIDSQNTPIPLIAE